MPLTFDLPLEDLYEYRGTNPRPEDFDEFWDASLKEVETIPTETDLEPAGPRVPFAECFDLFYTGVGGARIHAKLVRPVDAPSPHPAVVMFHGYSGNAGDWFDKLPYAARGFTVAALDVRGQGGLSEDVGGAAGTTLRGHIIRGIDGPPEGLLFRQVFMDTVQLVRIVMAMPEVDPDRVGVTGASQGGGLTLACAALEPRVSKAAPVYPFLCDYKRLWEIDLDKDAYAELKDYFRRFDPTHRRAEQLWTKLGYIDVQHLAPRITADVLMGVGLRDTVCPPSSQFAAYNRIPGHKSLVLYPDFGHEGLPGHNDRVFEFLAGL